MRLQIEFSCPNTRPDESPLKMVELQEKLDRCAQQLFGSRKKNLFPPTFVQGGPNVRNTPDLTGGNAELSLNAAGYWPTAIFELAHETIHLLDPRPGYPECKGASWFEEGLAVHFSLEILKEIGDKNQKVSSPEYRKAVQLFSRIGGDLYYCASEIRKKAGHFSDATADDFKSVSPNLKEHLAIRLAESFYEKKKK